MFKEDQLLFKEMADLVFEIFDNMDPVTEPDSMTKAVLATLGDRVGFMSETTLASLSGMSSSLFASAIRRTGATALIIDQVSIYNKDKVVPFGVVFSASEEALLEKAAELRAFAKTLNVVAIKSSMPPRANN